VIAAGPWTGPLSKSILSTPIRITSYAGHSLLVRPSIPLNADCLFINLATGKSSYHPEIFPRTPGQVYSCGVNDNLVLPPTPESAILRKRDLEKLREVAEMIFPEYTV
jgi:glycine/D-amino acid oxidase-like deaminating enzyme